MPGVSRYIADFDSTTSVLSAVSNYLHNRNTPVGGKLGSVPEIVLSFINALPGKVRKSLYKWSGWYDAYPADGLKEIRTEDICEWVVSKYPERKFPALFIGTANGAEAHLAAAMNSPFLPQTFLLPVRRSVHPDDLEADIAWGKKHVPLLTGNNPALRVYQMHDPIQDRLMVQKMAYLRIKLISMSEAYIRFIEKTLNKDAVIIICNCRLKWKSARINDSHYFQPGGFGAADENDIISKSPRVSNFLREQGSDPADLKIPQSEFEVPEAEWGFDEELLPDIERAAEKSHRRIISIEFEKPDDMSSFTAELYKWWYSKRKIPYNKMLVECFSLIEPKRVIDSRMIPYWLAFNTQNSTDILTEYLKNDHTVPEKYIMIMSNGIRSIDVSMPEDYEKAFSGNTSSTNFLGLDKLKYPVDLKSYGIYDKHLNKLPVYDEKPEPLTVDELLQFYEENKTRFRLTITS